MGYTPVQGEVITITSGAPAVSRGSFAGFGNPNQPGPDYRLQHRHKASPPTGYFLAAPIRNFWVPQTAQTALVAARRFFRTTCCRRVGCRGSGSTLSVGPNGAPLVSTGGGLQKAPSTHWTPDLPGTFAAKHFQRLVDLPSGIKLFSAPLH